MKKYAFILGLILSIVISYSLYNKYDTFVFHAYETVLEKGIYAGKNEDIEIEGFTLVEQNGRYEAGNASIYFTDLDLEGLEIDLIADGLNYVIDYTLESEGKIKLGVVEVADVENLSIRLIYPSTLDSMIIPLTALTNKEYACHAENYSITDFYVDGTTVIFGYINSKDEKIIEEYPKCTLEYDYVNEDHDVAFLAKTGDTADFINSNTTFVEDVDVLLEDYPIKVIISLSNDKEQMTFEMVLSKDGVE